MTEKDESVKNNTEHTEENENVKNEASSSNDVENNPSEEELNNESTSEHDNDDKNDQSKDEEIQQLQLKANENEEKYLRLYAEFENYKRRIRNENETNKNIKLNPCLLIFYLLSITLNVHFKLRVMTNHLNLSKRRSNDS